MTRRSRNSTTPQPASSPSSMWCCRSACLRCTGWRSRGWEGGVLLWSDRGRAAAWTLTAVIIGVIYAAPLAVILLASFAGQWNGVLPSLPTFGHYADAVSGASAEMIEASLVTGAVASLVALIMGTWAALALRPLAGRLRR